jgi:hypothetical protein
MERDGPSARLDHAGHRRRQAALRFPWMSPGDSPIREFTHWSVATLALLLLPMSGGAALAVPQGRELLFSNAQHADALNDKDRRAIFAQLGLKVAPDGACPDFVDAECPAVKAGGGDIQAWTEDLNGDRRPEVFVSPGGSCMFGNAGTGVILFNGDGAGHWKPHNLGAGMVVVQATSHQGCADLMIGGPCFCQPVQRWDGGTCVFDRNVAEQPCAGAGQ